MKIIKMPPGWKAWRVDSNDELVGKDVIGFGHLDTGEVVAMVTRFVPSENNYEIIPADDESYITGPNQRPPNPLAILATFRKNQTSHWEISTIRRYEILNRCPELCKFLDRKVITKAAFEKKLNADRVKK